MQPLKSCENQLPSGWQESSPGGLVTNTDEMNGGIIDRALMTDEWFVIFNRAGMEPVDGLKSRSEAFEAFAAAMAKEPEMLSNAEIAKSISKAAETLGCAQSTVFELYRGWMEGQGRSIPRSAQRLEKWAVVDQIKASLDAGITPDQIAQAIWGEGSTWTQVSASYSLPVEEIDSVWEGAGFEVCSTGGGFWAAVKSVDGIDFWLTDYAESRTPNPSHFLNVAAYVAGSGEHLGFTNEAKNLQDALAKIPEWSSALQGELRDRLASSGRAAKTSNSSPRM